MAKTFEEKTESKNKKLFIEGLAEFLPENKLLEKVGTFSAMLKGFNRKFENLEQEVSKLRKKIVTLENKIRERDLLTIKDSDGNDVDTDEDLNDSIVESKVEDTIDIPISESIVNNSESTVDLIVDSVIDSVVSSAVDSVVSSVVDSVPVSVESKMISEPEPELTTSKSEIEVQNEEIKELCERFDMFYSKKFPRCKEDRTFYVEDLRSFQVNFGIFPQKDTSTIYFDPIFVELIEKSNFDLTMSLREPCDEYNFTFENPRFGIQISSNPDQKISEIIYVKFEFKFEIK